jgi:hypothetical protein
VAALVVLAAAIGLSGCLGLGEDRSAEGEHGSTVAAAVKPFAPVRRSPQEWNRARRLISASAYVQRIGDDAGGYEIAGRRILRAAERDRILGVLVDVRLGQPVDGIYEIPVVCREHGDAPVALPATPYDLHGVRSLRLTVTSADDRVAAIEPLKGRFEPEPGAAYLSAPSRC